VCIILQSLSELLERKSTSKHLNYATSSLSLTHDATFFQEICSSALIVFISCQGLIHTSGLTRQPWDEAAFCHNMMVTQHVTLWPTFANYFSKLKKIIKRWKKKNIPFI